jgi:hypothetical protein
VESNQSSQFAQRGERGPMALDPIGRSIARLRARIAAGDRGAESILALLLDPTPDSSDIAV